MTSTPGSILRATRAARQAILDEYLDWMADPASQPRQCHEDLYRPGTGQCCALGALGDVLARHGFAQKSGEHIAVLLPEDGGQAQHYVSNIKLPDSVLDALGLCGQGGEIMRLNDTHRWSFARIAGHLRALKPEAPQWDQE